MVDPIVVVPYDPNWPAMFRETALPMREALGAVALRIDHIGSTSIPGLDAKPVIDIQISVAAFEPLDSFRLPLQRLGYVWRANNDDLTKRYFRESPGARRTHIHVRCAGSWAQQFALLFRDYVRLHPDEAARYATRKHRLAVDHRNERQGYTNAKSPLIWEIMQRADVWAQHTGWQPAPSDI